LRLHDNPALTHAVQLARQRRTWLLPVVVIDPAQTTALTRWGFARQGPHRAQFVAEAVAALAQALHALGTPLWVWHADPVATLTACMQQLQASALVCEDIAAPEEQATVAAIRARATASATTSASGNGVQATVAAISAVCEVHAVWQSTLYAPEALPMPPHQVPDTFTAFRRQLEASGATEAAPLPAVTDWPKVPGHEFIHPTLAAAQAPLAAHAPDPLASLRPSHVPTQAHAPDTASTPHCGRARRRSGCADPLGALLRPRLAPHLQGHAQRADGVRSLQPLVAVAGQRCAVGPAGDGRDPSV
jgi:deoxyribodipyrimidine photo-lyase